MNTKIFSLLLALTLLLAGCYPSAGASPAGSVNRQNAPAPSANPTSEPAASPVTGESQPVAQAPSSKLAYPLVDTGQGKCYDNTVPVACPTSGAAFFGQDAQYQGSQPRYQDNGDGTVTDLVTGLMWQQDPGDKMTYAQAVAGAAAFTLAGYTDWRLPSIKELYSLILFDGTDVSSCNGTCSATPFIDTRYFNFQYGDTSSGERIIDAQFASSTKYVSTTMNGDETVFGVNFADGRIKGYGLKLRGGDKTFFVLHVRGSSSYGQNKYLDNGDGTITDAATGLVWMQPDSGGPATGSSQGGMNWEAALETCENLAFAGASDWRLPDVKELQSIVDYSRAPATTGSAAIDPLFKVTAITGEAGETDYPFYWSSTTHADSSGNGTYAAYVAFGKALGYIGSNWLDVHGAGAQRSDPKTGSASEYPQGHGPQGDAVRVLNYVRCVRGGDVTATPNGSSAAARPAVEIQSTGIGQPSVGETLPVPGGGQNQPGSAPAQSGPPAAGRMPPPEAIKACAQLSAGTACQVDTPTGTVTGACRDIQQQLACVPAAAPMPAAGLPTAQAASSSALSSLSAESCLKDTTGNAGCKDCCDCLPTTEAAAIKACRDACAEHDFSQNSASLVFIPPSQLGPAGDYSLFTAGGSQQECKRLCDSSATLACGDRRFCRDACNKLADSGAPAGENSSQEKPPQQGPAATPPPPGQPRSQGKAETEKLLSQVAGEYIFTEGPAADAQGNVYFSDISAGRIYKWSPDGRVSVFLDGLKGPNGLAFARDGLLVACEGGNGRLIAIDSQGKITPLVEQYQQVRFNEPNDLWIDPQGGIYFTDPAYQLPVVQDGEHVYYLTPDRSQVVRVISDLVRPNGIVGTPDGKTLYVADHGAGQTFAYTIQGAGALTDKRLVVPLGSDGMALDAQGNLYLTTPGGVQIYNAAGNHLQDIPMQVQPTNLTFGGQDGRTLFITARTAVYTLQ